MLEKKPRILAELRPALEGFAGIPQETRLLFSAFRDFEDFQTIGLINQYRQKLSHGIMKNKSFNDKDIHKKINLISRHIISHKEEISLKGFWKHLFRNYIDSRDYGPIKNRAIFGIPEKISYLDIDGFEDFIWSTLFSKSVSLSEYDKIVTSIYAVITSGWQHMHRCGIKHNPILRKQEKYPKLDTRDFDFFVTQTPFPGVLSRRTKMVIRYHDAIPIYLPHTIPDTKFHQRTHYMALKDNVKRKSIFVCTTQAVRNDLCRIFPSAEEKSTVIHDIVSSQYYEQEANVERICNIIKSKIEQSTQPNFLNNTEKVRFYDRHVRGPKFNFLLMVSTIEPRKNHGKLIGAWEIMREKLDPDLKLVIVGKPGWGNDKVLNAMQPWQEKGQLFNLSAVPSPDLRVLYNSAKAVVCPSISEGFDLSGIEAMLSGGVVAASDIPVHREVYGDCSEYFNPYSFMQCANAIEKIIHPDNQINREALKQKGLKHGRNYLEENIAPKWHEFFKSNINQ
jgi:glycosyltransferase involved in cell wall biosynthesis